MRNNVHSDLDADGKWVHATRGRNHTLLATSDSSVWMAGMNVCNLSAYLRRGNASLTYPSHHHIPITTLPLVRFFPSLSQLIPNVLPMTSFSKSRASLPAPALLLLTSEITLARHQSLKTRS